MVSRERAESFPLKNPNVWGDLVVEYVLSEYGTFDVRTAGLDPPEESPQHVLQQLLFDSCNVVTKPKNTT